MSVTSFPPPLNKLPVIVPEAVTAPVTSKATEGLLFKIPTLSSEPSTNKA